MVSFKVFNSINNFQLTFTYLISILAKRQPTWGKWENWLSCSQTCGSGTRTRLRACKVPDGCSGQSVQTGTCNEGPCPNWSDWSGWGDCSADCGGGIQTRSRNCLNVAEEDCSGSSNDEQQCNRQSCDGQRAMIYWNNIFSYSREWNYVRSGLSGEGTFFEQCADYCNNKDSCNAIAVIRTDLTDYDDYYDYKVDNDYYTDGKRGVYECYINLGEFYHGPSCYGSACYDPDDHRLTLQLGVFRDYYKAYPVFLPSNEPDGIIGASPGNVRGVCDETSTAFGNVNYRNME